MDGSSVFKKAAVEENIEIMDVHEWFAKNLEGNVDLMKINIEGGEYELLERLLETKEILRIRNIQVQFHNIDKRAKVWVEEIRRKLSDSHNPTFQYDFVWDNWQLS